jgi:peroxiredoxin Q/BCP
MQKTI